MEKKLAKWKWMRCFFLLLPLLIYFTLPETVPEVGKRVIAIFTFAAFSWAFEIIPLYATSLWIVVFLSFFFISPSDVKEYEIFYSSFSSPIILLFFGGFVLAAAIRKHKLDELLLNKVLRLAGSNTYAILGVILLMSAFFSMWISNTAAAAMVLALSKPLFQALSNKDPMRKALPLAIAFGCNIGGMGTPIGTPPNAIALGILREYGMEIHFINWMIMTIPLIFLILIFVFFLLSFLFPPNQKSISVKVKKGSSLTLEGKKVACIAGLMIFSWLSGALHGISETWIALAGVGLLASFRLISVEDLQRIDWDILLLMWGGLALGLGIEKSQILYPYLPFLNSYQEFAIIGAIGLLALFLSTFISNTATANLILPFAIGIASVEASLIAVPITLACSLAMALPVSTPPNALAYSYGSLKVYDICKAGLIVSVGGFILVLAGFQWIVPWILAF